MKLLKHLYLGALIGLPTLLMAVAAKSSANPWQGFFIVLFGIYLQGKWAMLFINAMTSDPTKVR